MIRHPNSRTLDAQEEMLALLEHGQPMTARDFINQVSAALGRDHCVYSAIGNLLKSGQIIEAPPNPEQFGANGKPLKRYVLAPPAVDAALVAALTPAPDARPTVTYPLSAVLETPVDHSPDAGRMDTEWPDALETRPATPVKVANSPPLDDFVIRAIDRLSEPRWQEGAMHAQRLRALASSPVLRAAPDVETWLVDLAGIIEAMAA